MEQYEYKQDIINTRVGGFGGSDSTMLAQVANLGKVTKPMFKRMAICKGLIPPPDSVGNTAMRYGDYIENQIYQYLVQGNKDFQSNPMLVSEKYSKPNCRLFCHPDFLLVDESKQTIKVYECKTTRYSVQDTKINYRTQLYVEWLLAKELAAKKGNKWRVKLYLVHYDTSDLNLEEHPEYDTERLTVNEVRFKAQVFDVNRAMTITDEFLQDFNEFYEEDEINANYLPEKVQSQFNKVATFLREIKEREEKVEEFKSRLYDFMQNKGIKKVACEDFAFTLVAPSETSTMDYKKCFIEEIESKHPRTAAKMKNKYQKVTKRKGFVKILVKEKE